MNGLVVSFDELSLLVIIRWGIFGKGLKNGVKLDV